MENEFLDFPDEVLEKPYLFFDENNNDLIPNTKNLLKSLYEKLKSSKSRNKEQDFLVEDLDEEQIWSQMDKKVSMICKNSEAILERIIESRNKQKIVNEKLEATSSEENYSEQEAENDIEDLASGGVEDEDFENTNQDNKKLKDQKKGKKTIDDINYDEMENFLEMADRNKEFDIDLDEEEEEDEEDQDPNQDDDLEEDDEQLKPKNFFKNPEEEDEENIDEDIENEVFDTTREMLLKEKDLKDEINSVEKENSGQLDNEIDKLERGLLGKKNWQMQGEVKANQRPKNSLLEEHLDFKSGLKLDSDIPKEVIADIEKIIKQRILDEAWDDPLIYEGPDYMKENFNSAYELNYEKNEKGLAEVYEDEYKRTILNIPTNTEESKLKLEIERLFKEVCYNIDALSNFSFTPKPYIKPAEIISNAPSIIQEEKIPIFFSENQRKAPQELFKARNVSFENNVELSHEERRQKRREKKRNLRTHLKHKLMNKKIKKLMSLGQTKFEYNQVKKSRAKLKEELKKKNEKSVKFTSSTQFFNNLQKTIDNPQEKQGNKKFKSQSSEKKINKFKS